MDFTVPKNNRSRLFTFIYGDPEDLFLVTDCFTAISRYVDRVGPYNDKFGILAAASLELFGWGHLAITKALQNTNINQESLFDARAKDSDNEEVISLLYYWKLRTGLLKLPLSWERPNLIEGDPMCNRIFRRQNDTKHPTFKNKPYFTLARKLKNHALDGLETVLEFDLALVSVYGKPKVPHLTIEELLTHNPKLQDHFFCPFDMM